MKSIISIFLIASAVYCGSPKEQFDSSASSEEIVQNDILVGKITKEDLTQAPYSAWFEPMYKSYKPSPEALETIKNNINDYKIKVFMGTWCGDSKREVPKLFKLLEESGFNMKNLEVQAVKYDKTLPDDLQKEYNIQYVPTIIFYKNGKEVNRFVEYPQESLEEDIAKIVSGKEYQHPYQ